MTYEDFTHLTENLLHTIEPSVYRVDVFRIESPINRKVALSLSPGYNFARFLDQLETISDPVPEPSPCYPEFKVRKSNSFVLPTLESAISFISSAEISRYDQDPVYCIHICELPFGKDIISDCCRRRWVFDGDGQLIGQSVCSSLIEDLDKIEGNFWGRPADTIPFRPGDLVEVHDRENSVVRLAVVVFLCNDIDYCWRMYQKCIEMCIREDLLPEDADTNYWLNASDDCYCVAYGPACPADLSYSYTTDIHRPRFPIPASLRKDLTDSFESIKADFT